jgi:hypothetical protein
MVEGSGLGRWAREKGVEGSYPRHVCHYSIFLIIASGS